MTKPRFAAIDFHAMARAQGVDLHTAFGALRALYDDIDARNAVNTQNLTLPCHKGCDMCCHQSVFVTPLEFFYMWDWAQQHLTNSQRDAIVTRGLALYEQFSEAIAALERPPETGSPDHTALARTIAFTCPMLTSEGACGVYPARELLARLFGCSFNDAGGVYGCHLVAAHLAHKTVRLLPARPTARRLHVLPLTFKRQIYPYYFQLLFGAEAAACAAPTSETTPRLMPSL